MMLTLYDYLDSGNGYKARLLLHQLAIPYDRVELDIDRQETRSETFLAINPNGRVPTLVLEDGSALPESNAILWYLAEGTPFLPEDRIGRARALQWMFFEQYSHEPYIAVLRYWHRHGHADAPDKRTQIPAKTAGGHAALAVMERHLDQTDWFTPGAYGIADIALYAYTHVAAQGGFDLGSYPRIRIWLDRVAGQPRHIAMTDPGNG